tara:strand:+ start:52382 stop:54631 length:2250 start_codon:yes stop_codon:yes gene_type:complete
MYFTLVLFSLGVILTCQLPALPTGSAPLLLLVGVFVAAFRRITRPLAGLCLGLLYSMQLAGVWLEQRIPPALEGMPLIIVGQVSNLPIESARGWKFQFIISEGQLKGRKVALVWYEDFPPQAGDNWRLSVRLSRPRGSVNFGLFDYEGWLLSQGIHGSGYVLEKQRNQKLSSSGVLDRYQQIRQSLGSLVRDHIVRGGTAESPAQGMLLALLLGESSQLTPEVWNTLSATGTNHLMIISGLHVSFVMGLLFWLSRRISSRRVAVIVTILGTTGYSLLAGFGLPAQRALVMSSIGLLVITGQREPSVWRALVLALTGVLLMNPFAPLSAGFWLSFTAVAGLLGGFAGINWHMQSWLVALLRTQWIALTATFPFLLCWVFKVSLLSVLANLVAVPVVTLLVVPMMLVETILLLLSDIAAIELLSVTLIRLITLSLEWLLWFLEVLADLNWVLYEPASTSWPLFLAVLAAIVLLSPKRSMPRWMGLILCLPLFTLPEVSRREEAFRVDVLDVGQGLSVIISNETTTILYDAGPAVGRFDAGARIVLPALRRLGVSEVDLMVISHGDNDHAGGSLSVRAGLPVLETVSQDLGLGCHFPRQWQFQDLKVSLLTPGASDHLKNRNDLSCVLLIEDPTTRVLLPGDIEADGEQSLIHSGLGAVDFLISPHHGSASSSTPMFINRLAPKWTVHSAGYQNRFQHPDEVIVRRYRNRGIRQFNVADTGALTFRFLKSGVVDIREARRDEHRFWYDSRRF